jgi:replicative DNA helicase
MIQDKRNAAKVLGCLFQRPAILAETDKYLLTPDDFTERIHRIIFSAIYNMYHSGATNINIADFNAYLQKYPGLYKSFEDSEGNEAVLLAIEVADLTNFNFYYDRLKKLSLLRSLKQSGFDISEWHKEGIMDIIERQELENKLERTELKEIIHSVQGKLSQVESEFLNKRNFKLAQATSGARELIERLKARPEIGYAFEGDIFSTVVRGARRGKVYSLSADTGVGKSRFAVMQACRLAYPLRWSMKKHEWENVGSNKKILFITTELDDDEIRTMIIAYVSGVNEAHILNGEYEPGEEERVLIATDIMEYFSDNFLIYHMPDPTIDQLNSNVRRLVITKQLDSVFFDYIHTSPQLLTEFGGARIREDVILNLVSTALKNLANELNVIVWTGTQVNRESKETDFADTNSLRGARSIADKVDMGGVLRPASPEFLKTIKPILQNSQFKPNRFIDIYKNRRSEYKSVRLWIDADLGTMRVKDCFLTDQYGDLKAVDLIKVEDSSAKISISDILKKTEEEPIKKKKEFDISQIPL